LGGDDITGALVDGKGPRTRSAPRHLSPCPWPSRSVSNMLNSHAIFENAIENFERLAHERRNVQTGPLFDLRRDPRFST